MINIKHYGGEIALVVQRPLLISGLRKQHSSFMRLINRTDIPVIESFIRLFGDEVKRLAPHYEGDIVFKEVDESDNRYGDNMGRLGNCVYVSDREVGRLGLSDSEILASLAHEVGHIVYSTAGWLPDCEQRADSFAAELGLGNQMISAIEKILDSRRYSRLTSLLVERIHFLQNTIRS